MSQPIGENDPEAYHEAADRVTADSDRDVWVVQKRHSESQEWSVAAVLTSYQDVRAYMDDFQTFSENCPKDSPEEHCRSAVHFRVGSPNSPTNMYESWPPDAEEQ
jgi:hypothetical protein